MQLHDLPARAGTPPRTTDSAPHTQLDQNAPLDLQAAVLEHALALPDVRRGRSGVSVPDAIAFYLDAPLRPADLPDLFGGEWGHLHPARDGSMHLNVPTPVAERLIELGWAEYHYVVTRGWVPPVVVMLYGPRDAEELAVATAVVETAYVAAGGALTAANGRRLAALHLDGAVS